MNSGSAVCNMLHKGDAVSGACYTVALVRDRPQSKGFEDRLEDSNISPVITNHHERPTRFSSPRQSQLSQC